jgi:hypothetical protein
MTRNNGNEYTESYNGSLNPLPVFLFYKVFNSVLSLSLSATEPLSQYWWYKEENSVLKVTIVRGNYHKDSDTSLESFYPMLHFNHTESLFCSFVHSISLLLQSGELQTRPMSFPKDPPNLSFLALEPLF